VNPKGTPSKYLSNTWIAPDGKNHIQMLDAPAVCSIGHYLVVTNVKEKLSVGKVGTKALIWSDSTRRS